MTPASDMIALATGDTGMRELDHRSSDDIEVTLLWSARTDRVFVLVLEVDVLGVGVRVVECLQRLRRRNFEVEQGLGPPL